MGILLLMLLTVLVLACSTGSEATPTQEPARESEATIVAETPDLTGAFTADQLIDGATTLLEAGDLAGAESFLNEILRIDPENPAALHKLGFVLLGQERYDEAKDAFSQELAVDPEFPDAWLGLALARVGSGQPNEALEALNTALRLDPENADAIEARQALTESP